MFATNYYVDNINGSDSNTGLTPTTAWQTLNKVNAASYTPGDSILFVSGGLWRGQLQPKSGSAAGNIIYAAYGTGAKPLLLGSVNVSATSDWVSLGSNIWQSVATSTVDVGNLIFNGAVSCGVKKWSAANLLNQGDFWYDGSGTKTVEIYSTSNPATFYTDIEAALGNFIIFMQADSFITIQNFALQYGAADGIEVRNSHHIMIEDCELSYIGGTELTPNVRYGGGIQFWAKSHDNIVQRCKLWEIYDDALTNQGNASAGGTVQQYNLFYWNNIIWNCSESSFCFFIQPATVSGSYLKNIYFENNTCANAGGGWAASQRPDLKGFQIYCSANTAPTDSIFIRNNIFYKSRCFIFVDNSSVQTWSYTTSDYNCWYTLNNADTIVAFWTSALLSIYTEPQFTSYQSATHQDQHSFIADPLFVNSSANNYYLTAASPCINTGTNTGITTDFNLTPRPNGSYDIGAYEYINTTGINNITNCSELNIYPNPNNGNFVIEPSNGTKQTMQVYDVNGKVVLTKTINGKTSIDASGLSEGVYNISLQSNEGVVNKRLVIVR